ncbi:MAG: Uma2 family endonuclease [Dehalococcoidia bacterium]
MAIATRVSLETFTAIPDFDERRLELIDGEVLEKPMPTWDHGRAAGNLFRLTFDLGSGAVEPRAMIPAGPNREASSPLPDFAFYLAGPPADGRWMIDPPTIAAEVLSPGQTHRAMQKKVDLYLTFGVKSVWVIDLDGETFEVFEGETRRLWRAAETLRTAFVPGLAINLAAFFEEVKKTPEAR